MVSSSDLMSDFLGYRSKLEDVEGRSDLCQIVMTKDGYKAIRPFEKDALYVINALVMYISLHVRIIK